MTKEEPPTEPLEPLHHQDAAAGTLPSGAAPKKRPVSRIVTPILALVAALAIGLFGGVLIGHSTASAASPTRAGFTADGARGAGGGGGFGGGGNGAPGAGAGAGISGFTTGKIVSVNGDTVTVKKADGSTVTVTTSPSTTVTKTTKSSVSKLSAGESIRVIGATDGSGNVTATTITEGAGGLGFGRPGGAPTTK